MTFKMKGFAIVGAAALSLVSGFFWTLDRTKTESSVDGGPVPVIEPGEIKSDQPCLEYHEAIAKFALCNPTTADVTITDVTVTCNCVTIKGADGGSVKGRSVPANGKLDLTAKILTKAAYGKFRYTICISWKDAGLRTGDSLADIVVDVLGGPRPFPAKAVFTKCDIGVERSVDIDLYDAYPDGGTRIVSISTSHPQELTAVMVDGTEPLKDSATLPAIPQLEYKFIRRGRLVVTFKPQEARDLFRGFVKLVPEDAAVPPIVVPVYGQR